MYFDLQPTSKAPSATYNRLPMDDPVRLAIVGCGGMGRRHLAGLAELSRTPHMNLDLVAVCDLNRQNAEDLADEAHELLGERPRVFGDAETMVREVDGLEAADCPTDTGSHHRAATQLLELGLNTLCEKPLALTIRGCKRIIDAAEKSGRILSVAENFRRDPMNRLVRALLDDGAIGDRQFMTETDIGGRDSIIITPWRHMKMTGTITLDAGVHNADILQYYFGDAASAFGQVRLYEKTRVRRNTDGPGGFYAKWAANMPESIEADRRGRDLRPDHVRQWRPRPVDQPPRRSRRAGARAAGVRHPRLDHLARRPQRAAGAAAPGRRPRDRRPAHPGLRAELPPRARSRRRCSAASASGTTTSISRPRTASSWRSSTTRWRAASAPGTQPEVTGEVARRDVALVYALFESDRAGRPVTIEEVESGAVDAYQREIDEQLGLLARPSRLGASRRSMRIGYNTWSMATVPYRTSSPALSDIGFTAIAISVVPGYTIGGQLHCQRGRPGPPLRPTTGGASSRRSKNAICSCPRSSATSRWSSSTRIAMPLP